MIPQEKDTAVSRAIQQAFGATSMDDIRKMTKGLSSDLVFRIVVKGSPYLLRIMTRMNEQMDPGRIFACMNTTSDAGLTPRVRYTNAEDGISITDFVEDLPLPATQALHLIPCTLRTLHALPPFPKEFNYVTAHNYFIWRFRKASLLPQDEIDDAFTSYEQLCATYPRVDADMVSCHMDLKPDNILFDGHRIWLVDWQSGFLNDRYFDLAVAASFVVNSDAEEATYLGHYFVQPPDEYQRARFFLMRQALHMLSASVFLLLGSAGKPIGEIEDLPSFEDFHRRIWAGEINFADRNNQILTGMIHWKRLLHNIHQSRFAESLRTIATRHPEATRRLFPPPN
jgi:aminoglycoside phosphotransferase (APT) family kinase protein